MYTFRFHRTLDELEPGSTVTLSLYWQQYKMDRYEKQFALTGDRRIEVEMTPGGRRKTVPPGVYRLRLTGKSLQRQPSVVRRMAEYISVQEEDTFNGLFQGQPGYIEYAVSVGTREQSLQFQKQFLCELRKRGRELIDAWSSWKSTATSAYEKEQEKIAMKLFDRFIRVQDAVKRVQNWIQKKKQEYVILPNPSLRGELLKLSYVLSKKVNALSMTVLRQVGVSPILWPDPYVERGFGPNINVLLHMEQYDKETIEGVQNAIDESRVNASYFDLKTYAVTRLRRLVRFVEQLEQLKTPPQLRFLKFHLSGEGHMIKHHFTALNQYAGRIIRLHREGLPEHIKRFSRQNVRSAFRNVLDQLPLQATHILKEVSNEFSLEAELFAEISLKERSSSEGWAEIQRALRSVTDVVSQEKRGNLNCP